MLVISALRRRRQEDRFKVILNCIALERLACANWDTVSTQTSFCLHQFFPICFACMHTYIRKQELGAGYLLQSLSTWSLFKKKSFKELFLLLVCTHGCRYCKGQNPLGLELQVLVSCSTWVLRAANTLSHWTPVGVPCFPWNSLIQLNWLVCQPQGSSWLCLTGAGTVRVQIFLLVLGNRSCSLSNLPYPLLPVSNFIFLW